MSGFRARLDVLADLHDALISPISHRFLTEFTADSLVRTNVLSGAIFGHVRWRRSFARPMTAEATDAFKVTHVGYQHFESDNSDGEVTFDGFFAVPFVADPPILLPGPDDEEYERVTYVALSGVASNENAEPGKRSYDVIRVELAPTSWLRQSSAQPEPPPPLISPQFLYVSPPETRFNWYRKQIILATQEVDDLFFQPVER